LEVRNCTVDFGTYGRDLKGNTTTLKIHGQTPFRAAPLVLRFDPTNKDFKEVNLNLGVRKDPVRVAISMPGRVHDPFLDRILTGQLNIEGGSPVSIKAGTAMEPQISIVGNAEMEACELQADGLHVSAKGNATGITADKEDQMPSKLTTLLR